MKMTKCAFQAGLVAGVVAVSVATWVGSGIGAERPKTLRNLYGLEPPRALEAKKTALVLVDFQLEFVTGRLPLSMVHSAIKRARALVDWAQREQILVVLVQQVVDKPSSPVFAAGSESTAFVPELTPKLGDLVIRKSLGGAFSRTNLDAELRSRGIDTLVICGLMTHLAVLSSAMDATVLGYRTIVAGDATATRALPGVPGEAGIDAALLKRAALDLMADRVADVMLVRQVIELPVRHRKEGE